MNIIAIAGNLGNDPEVRTVAGGLAVVDLSVATESRIKRGGEWTKETQWHKVVLFGAAAENAGKYLRKGSKVGVTGELRYESWEKDGVKRTAAKIYARDVDYLSKVEAAPQSYSDNQPDDDIPF